MALTTVTAIKTHLGLTTTDEDTFLQQSLEAVEATIKKLIDRDIESQSYTDFYCGTGNKILILNEYPVTAVSEVREDDGGYWGSVTDSFGTSTVLTSGVDYSLVLDGRGSTAGTGRLYRINGVWSSRWEGKRGLLTAGVKPGAGNIRVTYTAGYASNAIPKDLQLAVWLIVAQIRAARGRGQFLQSERLGEYQYQLAQLSETFLRAASVEQILARYRRVRDRVKPLG